MWNVPNDCLDYVETATWHAKLFVHLETLRNEVVKRASVGSEMFRNTPDPTQWNEEYTHRIANYFNSCIWSSIRILQNGIY